MLMIRVSNQDTPWTIKISLVLALQVWYIRSVIDRYCLEPFHVTINIHRPWKEKPESVSPVQQGKWSLRTDVHSKVCETMFRNPDLRIREDVWTSK